MYDNKMDKTKMANSLVDIICHDYGLKLENWRASMMDRDATNNKALNLLNAEEKTRVTVIPCFSHGLANVGNNFKMGEGDLVLKRITKMVHFRL
jgi:hypothetical protein